MVEWNEFQSGRWCQYPWTARAHGSSFYIDPYMVWADLRGFADLGKPPDWIPVLLRLGTSAAELAELFHRSRANCGSLCGFPGCTRRTRR